MRGRDSGFGVRDSNSHRPSSRVENPIRIERMFHRRTKGTGITERAPDVELLLQRRFGAEHHNVTEDVAARSHALDNVSLHTDVSIDAKQTGPECGAANQLHVRN